MKNLTNENLGIKLRKLREDVQMEQEVIAKVLDIPRTAVSAFESGKRFLSALELVELCKVYRISPNELLGWNKSKSEIKPGCE